MKFVKEPKKDPVFYSGFEWKIEKKGSYQSKPIMIQKTKPKQELIPVSSKQSITKIIIPKNNSNLEVASNYQEDREAILSDIRYFRLRGNFSKILVGAYTLFTAAGLIFWVQGNPASVMVGIGTTYIGMSGTAISYALMKDYESSEIESEEELKNLTR